MPTLLFIAFVKFFLIIAKYAGFVNYKLQITLSTDAVGAAIGRPQGADTVGSQRARNARPYIFHRYMSTIRHSGIRHFGIPHSAFGISAFCRYVASQLDIFA